MPGLQIRSIEKMVDMKNRSHLIRIGLLSLFLATMCFVFCIQPLNAANVTLSWDANTPEPEGYRVFQRIEGQAYDYTAPVWPLDGANHTQSTCTIDGLTEGVTYYFVVRAYVGQDESGDSNEVQYQPTVTDSTQTENIAETDPVDQSTETSDTTTGSITEPSPIDNSGETDSSTVSAPTPAPVEQNNDVVSMLPDDTTEEVDSSTISNPTPAQIEQNNDVVAVLPDDTIEENDSSTYSAPEPTPTEENDDTLVAIPEDPTGEPERNTESNSFPQPSISENDLSASKPSLEVFDNDLSHQNWLSLQWSQYVASDGESRIAMGDIDGDGKDEIIVGLGQVYDATLPGGLFQVVDDDYSLLGWHQINWPDYNLANGELFPNCGDIDGDGDDEIFIGLGVGGEGMVEVLDFQNGRVVHLDWITTDWPEYNALLGQTHPAVGDIDNDGKDEIVIGLGSDYTNPQIPAGVFQVLDDDFSELSWGEIAWLEYNENNGESYPSVCDLNGDGKALIVMGFGRNGRGRVETFQYDAGIAAHHEWITIDWDDYNQSIGLTRPVCGDVDGDGRDEIIVGLGADPGDPAIPGGRFQIFDDDATHLTWAQIKWPEYNAANGESFPASGDIDADGIDEIFIGLGIQNAFAADTGDTATANPPSDDTAEGGTQGGGCFITSLSHGI